MTKTKFLYTGPTQTVSLKTHKATETLPAKFSEIDLISGKSTSLDPENKITKRLILAGYLEEAPTEATSPSDKNKIVKATEEK